LPALEGKVALIAGGGTGIGRATAELFAAEGARVVLFGRRAHRLEEAVAAIRDAGGVAAAVAGDVAEEDDVAGLVEEAQRRFGGVDVLVNSAAVRAPAPLVETSVAGFAEALRVNLLGAFVLTRAVVEPMRRRGAGSIVHISSVLGSVAVPLFAPYIASKGGLNQLARAAAVELVGDEIRVNVVAPGTIDTDAGAGVSAFRREVIARRIPIRRAGDVKDVACACLYLASDASRYVTGAILAVDGGWTAS
jgi:gluconate 5-dehydrogenase